MEIAGCYYQTRNKEKTRETLKALVEKFPDSEQGKQAVDVLKRLK